MIIGLTGTFAAGKDTVAEYLETKGFENYSTGDVVREIAQKKGIKLTRDNQRELANKLRDEFGPEFLSREIIEKKAKTDKIAVSGLRQPGEIEYLKGLGDFYLIAVDAPVEARFERMAIRKRKGDPKTLKEMVEKEKKEMESTGDNAQRIHQCMQMADKLVMNEGDRELLHKRVDEALSEFKK